MDKRNRLDAVAFFSTQLFVKVIRNLVASGAYDGNAALTNIHEALEDSVDVLGPEYREALIEVSQVFETSVRDVMHQLGEGKTRGS